MAPLQAAQSLFQVVDVTKQTSSSETLQSKGHHSSINAIPELMSVPT